MEIRPVGSNNPSGQRVSDTGNFTADVPSIAAREAASPVQTVNAVQQPGKVPDMNQVHDAVKQINDALKSGLEFSVDSDAHRTIVKVVDQQTKEVIRQMPTEEALEVAKALDRLQGLLVKQKA
ncbi:flagellar biosynthesis protein FlaG [Noviherbaspirillum cavernae]|uniref:Flagellar biosynthesis protein FlaG n=1 Tax=Noviherbaspirillum cavernae TaxID=2320862 RepID=A0A418X0E9_9BURK|nr:flagellar protein FlaG [Noviherbaspirillum cavernae]RJG05967.1 flagellar biosynthesis protein FlaG [Noviherbaspirillum cavernae]